MNDSFYKEADMNLNFHNLKQRLPAGRLIRHLRITAGLTTRELSLLMECSNSLITHWEEGRNPFPKARTEQVCRVFKITIEDFKDYTERGKDIPINFKDESIYLIAKMPEQLLASVYGILSNMNPQK